MTSRDGPPALGPAPEKITARHRERDACVYVRQSSPKQVLRNQESLRNQYALTDRARALGWVPERIRVIDADLGQSAQERGRRGFQELVAEVSLGRVGLILAYEASRLARNNADWYTLLDLAALAGALLADADGVYDPRSYNDRLLLGLRGMFSEAELHLLRLRLDAGRMRQVEAGTFRQHLPTGLVRREDGRVVKDPDQQVQHALELVFAHFAALGSVHQVLRRLRRDGIAVPRRHVGGPQAGELLWRLPSAGALLTILNNPAYAGAFAYGRRRAPEGVPARRRAAIRPLEEWTALRHGVYPAYIAWETFVANRARLANNRYHYLAHMQGAPRRGRALLVGLAVCGACGRQMYVRYKPAVRYECHARRDSHALSACQHVDGAGLEAAVVGAFFAALRPAELDLLDEALAALATERAQRTRQQADQVRRADYEARLAQRRYQATDPDNRLVAAELERQWELALRALAEAREAAARAEQAPAPPPLDPALREQVRDLGGQLPALWESGRLHPEQQKALLRSIIRRVVVSRPEPSRVEAGIVWVSGAVTRLAFEPTVGANVHLQDYPRLVERIRALSAAGHHDRDIARQLLAEGFHSAHRTSFPLRLVRDVRKAEGLPSLYQQCRGQARVGADWTVPGLARWLGVRKGWVYERIAAGAIPATRYAATGCYAIPNDPALLVRLRTLAQETVSRRRAL